MTTCKFCKQQIIRNEMVKHQNEECKAQFMLCPYSVYGCNFGVYTLHHSLTNNLSTLQQHTECQIRDMEKHCRLNELQHIKMKLDYLENQLFVPEIIRLRGMKGLNGAYIESNGKYYLMHKQQRNSALHHAVVYKKNGGYTLEFKQNESIWHLKSPHFGLIAYGIPKNQSVSGKQLSNFMNDNVVWSVYTKHGVKGSVVIDRNVCIEPLSLSEGVMKWKEVMEETDTEEINGEFEHNHQMDAVQAVFDGEGVVLNEGKNAHHQKSESWYDLVFGVEEKRKKRVTKTRMEMVGIMALTGITVYYLWSKFGKSHSIQTIQILQAKGGLLTPSQLLNW